MRDFYFKPSADGEESAALDHAPTRHASENDAGPAAAVRRLLRRAFAFGENSAAEPDVARSRVDLDGADTPASASTLAPAADALLQSAIHGSQIHDPAMAAALRAAAGALARWTWTLPASESNHDSGPSGLMTHSLRALCRAAPAIAGAPRMMRFAPDQAELLADRIRLAIAVAVLFHDAGKVLDVTVTAPSGAVWDPLAEPLREFVAREGEPVTIEHVRGRGGAGGAGPRHAVVLPAILARTLPAGVWDLLRPLASWLLEAVTPSLTFDATEEGDGAQARFSDVLGRIVASADHAAAAAGAPQDRPASSCAPEASPSKPVRRHEASAPAPAATAAASPDPETLSVSLPRFHGVLAAQDIAAAALRHGANSPDSPIVVGAHWVGVEMPSAAYDELLRAKLDELDSRKLLARCSGCAEGASECGAESVFTVRLALTRHESGREARMMFVHQRALDAPLPEAAGVFAGRITLVGEHTAKLRDFLITIPSDGRDVLAEWADARANGRLLEGKHWLRLRPADAPQTILVGIVYLEGIVPLLSEPLPDDSQERRKKLFYLWDRIMRMRRHIVTTPRRTAHTINTRTGRVDVVILDAPASQRVLADAAPTS